MSLTSAMQPATDTSASEATDVCYHCGERIPIGAQFTIELSGEPRSMCCPGCRAVAGMIAANGLESFYRQRTAYNEKPREPSEDQPEQYLIYDDPELAATFSDSNEDGSCSARLLLGGMSCAACTWLIEQNLAQMPGVERALVNLQQSRLDVRFEPNAVPLSRIFASLEALGYDARPFHSSTQRQQMADEYRTELRRLAVAGFGMMQVGTFAIALHAGDIQGIEQQYQGLLRGFSLLVASFVVVFSARPFFSTAWRHLKTGTLVMDLPVALAIGLAWLASAWATLTGTGQVYFDSVVMFTFFLLLGRFLERRVRQRNALTWFDAESALPDAAIARREGKWTTIPRLQLTAGDRILVPTGQTVSIDGCIVAGHSAVKEDTFNGEHLPRAVGPGDTVYAGTINVQDALEVNVAGNYRDSRLAALQRSVEQAQQEKPQLAKLADRIASWFVAAILLISCATALFWSQVDPQRAFWITLSVLVISCPCALALATPAALTSAASALRARGVIVRGENALEALARTTHLIFDKTGTLTEGNLAIAEVIPLSDLDEDQIIAIGATLQRYSSHPVAHAFVAKDTVIGFSSVEYRIGAGLMAQKGTEHWRMGSEKFCRELAPQLPGPPDNHRYWVALCRDSTPLAWIGLDDKVREEAATVVSAAKQAGLKVELLTGDGSSHGVRLAQSLGIESARTGLEPQQKMAHVGSLQDEHAVVSMVGDGLNDAPVLSMADASFAVAGATDLARTQADFVIVDGGLQSVTSTWQTARQTRRVILQNFGWALAYNVCAIPLAAMGFIPPWAAAIGMSLSSLLVVINSLRLNRQPRNAGA